MPQSRSAECLDFLTRLTVHKRKIHEPARIYTADVQRAKLSGLPVKAAKHVSELLKLETSVAARYIRDLVWTAALAGILDPEKDRDLFSAIDASAPDQFRHAFVLSQVYQHGYDVGHKGAPASDNPHQLGTEEATEWARGRADGFDARERENGSEGSSASAEREQPKGRRATPTNGADVEQPNGSVTDLPQKKRRGRPPKVRVQEEQRLHA